MNKEIKIHYNPYANDFPVDKRLPKTICGQKNNGNETHIKDGVTCSVCKRMFNNVDKFMNGGLQEILEDENRIKRMSFEEMENYERVNILNQQDKYNRFNIVDKHFYIQGIHCWVGIQGSDERFSAFFWHRNESLAIGHVVDGKYHLFAHRSAYIEQGKCIVVVMVSGIIRRFGCNHVKCFGVDKSNGAAV